MASNEILVPLVLSTAMVPRHITALLTNTKALRPARLCALLLAGLIVCAVLSWWAFQLEPLRAQETCRAPQPVCASTKAVFKISAFDPFASAIRISAHELVTTKRAVADRERVAIHMAGGGRLEGEVVPSGFTGDLALIRADLPAGPELVITAPSPGVLYVVALDRASARIEVFPEGKAILPVHSNKVGAHLHHTATAQSGGNGGALVNAQGQLIGVQVTGGSGRFEAVPGHHIETLMEMSGPEHRGVSLALGLAYRNCIALTGKAERVGDEVPGDIARELVGQCLSSGSRDLIERAGKILSNSRMRATAGALFGRALEIDPNAINARIGRAMVMGIERRHTEAGVDIRWLLAVLPGDEGIQRLALQAGKSGGDRRLINEALAAIAKHNRGALEAAKGFVGTANAPAPRL